MENIVGTGKQTENYFGVFRTVLRKILLNTGGIWPHSKINSLSIL